jgi:hypothetical protein
MLSVHLTPGPALCDAEHSAGGRRKQPSRRTAGRCTDNLGNNLHFGDTALQKRKSISQSNAIHTPDSRSGAV